MEHYQRHIEKNVLLSLEQSPAIFLNGPRQAGKTFLMKELAQRKLQSHYLTFDTLAVRSAALQDPQGFVQSLPTPCIIDEVQKVPALFPALKQSIDEARDRDRQSAQGRFLLTGSANILALPELSDALVGRMQVYTLYPLSAKECWNRPTPYLEYLFEGRPDILSLRKESDWLLAVMENATYPEVVSNRSIDRSIWFANYRETLMQRDVKDLANIEKLHFLPDILRLLAHRVTGLLNDNNLARDLEISVMTFRRYRQLLQNLFLIILIRPWFRQVSKRLVKAPKVFFIDTCLLCDLLQTDYATLLDKDPTRFGWLCENFVATELLKQISLASHRYELFHFRTTDGKEVDFVVEQRNGDVIGIEVKSSQNITGADFKGLITFKELSGNSFKGGYVLYSGNDLLPFGEGLWAVPISMLWG